MDEKYLRYISGSNLLIEPFWGHQQLFKIAASAEMAGNDMAFFDKMREESMSVDFFSNGSIVRDASEGIPNQSVATITMSGVMTVEDGWCHYGMRTFDRMMRSLYADASVSAIVIEMDSGGGHAAAGAMMYNTLQDRNKPVVTHYNMMASAALMGALPSDEIVASSPFASAGSIGVMMSIPKWYLEDDPNDPYATVDFYSRKSGDKNEVWRALKSGDTQKLIDRLTKVDEVFMDMVAKNRKLKGKKDYREKTLAGGMFPTAQAKRRGLTDSEGTLKFAIGRAMSATKYFSK